MQNQTLITVRDVEKSAEWYSKNFGFHRGHGGPYYEQLIYNGQLILQLHNMDGDENHDPLLKEDEPAGKGVLIWLTVDNFEEMVAKLKENKVEFDKEPFINPLAKQWEVWLHDLDGYRIVLASPSEYPLKPLEEA